MVGAALALDWRPKLRLTLTLDRPEPTGAWSLHLSDPAPNLPAEIWVLLDGRPYPFHAPPPAVPTHPINLLWRGEARLSRAILEAVRAMDTGELSQAQAEAIMAEQLLGWSRKWARAHGRIADRRGSRGRR